MNASLEDSHGPASGPRVGWFPRSRVSRPACPACLVVVACLALAPAAHGQLQLSSGQAELQTVANARQVLAEFSDLRIESIPPAMLAGASGVAIFPNMVKGGFILGVNFGKGVLMARRPDGSWSPPLMVTMGGGSLGFQAGLQSADIVLVFATPRSLQGMLAGQKVTLGADASVALGPIGRQANAATDARMGAEIYSYARTRGLFAGVSFNGASLATDPNANAMLYGRFNVTPQEVYDARGLAFHPEVERLIEDVSARARPAQPGATAAGQPGLVPAGLTSQPAPQVAPPALVPAPAPVGIAQPAPTQPAPAVTNPPLVPIR
jgi:lipid-binding SYLF domain-containing protein